MNASAFLIVLIQTTLCLTVGLIICAIARKSSGVRQLVSQIAIGASAILLLAGSLFTLQAHPIVAVNLPEAVAFTVPNTTNEIAPASQVQANPKENTTTEVAKTEAQPLPKAEPVYQSVSSFTVSKLVSMTYGAGFLLSLLPMAFGTLWIRKIRKSCRQVTEGTTFDVVKRVSERQGIRAPKLNASEAVTIPFVSGLFLKQIFVPINWVDGQCDIACSAIIEHEIAHIVSRDLERKFLCRVACSLVWFQPLAWMTFRIMGNASEELCDQSVLQAGVSNTAYADTLLRIRENAKRSNVPGLVIGAVSRESNLAKRMKLILATDVNRVKKVSRLVAGMAVLTLGAMAATSTFVFGQSSQTDQSQIGQGPYSGQVKLMDNAGHPINGAKVSLIVRAKDETERLFPLTVDGDTVNISDEVVKNSVVGTLLIETANGNIDFKRLWPAEHKIAEYRLAKPFTIRGKIGFPGSLTGPVKLNVRMLVRKVDEESHNFEFAYLEKLQPDFRSIQTDRNGNFELTGMPNGVEIALGTDDNRFSFDSMSLRAKPDDQGNYTPINYTLRLTSSVSGVVTRNGKPVVGMKIAAQGQTKSGWGEAITDAQGKYTIKQLSPEVYNIAAKLSDEEEAEFTVRAHEGVVVKEGEAKQGTNFEVIPGGIISGTLTDPNGKAIPNSDVGIYGPAHPRSSAWVQGAKTDAKGHFRTRVPAGISQVYYMGEGDTERPEVSVKVVDGMESKVQVICIQKSIPKDVNQEKSVPATETSRGRTLTMKCGAVINLELLIEKKGSVLTAWMPDGSKIENPEKNSKIAKRLKGLKRGGEGISALIEIGNLPSDSSRFFFKSNHMHGSGMSSVNGKYIETWIPLGKNLSGQDDLNLAIPTSPAKLKHSAPISEKNPVRRGKGPETILFALPDEIAKKDVLIETTMSDGRNLRIECGVFVSKLVNGKSTVQADMRPGQQLKSMKVWWREIEWATFKGVHMKAN